MLRAMRNDLKLNGISLMVIFLLMNILLVLAAKDPFSYRNSPTGFNIGLLFAVFMPLPLLLRDEKFHGYVLYRSLPLRPSQFILARYLLVILLGLATLLYGASYQFLLIKLTHVVAQFTHLTDSSYAVEHSLIARGLQASILISIAGPLLVRYGSVWRIILCYAVIWIFWGRLEKQLLHFSLQTSLQIGLSPWIVIATIFALAILAISYKLSVWWYGRREL